LVYLVLSHYLAFYDYRDTFFLNHVVFRNLTVVWVGDLAVVFVLSPIILMYIQG
jgi:hypothetical protein